MKVPTGKNRSAAGARRNPARLPLAALVAVVTAGQAFALENNVVGSSNSRPCAAVMANVDTGLPAETATSSKSQSARIRNGKLSVAFRDVPLCAAAAEVSRLTGVEIRFIGNPPETAVNLNFVDYPVERGLRLLLREANTVFLYSNREEEENRGRWITKIFVLAKGDSGNPGVAATNDIDSLSTRIQNALPRSVGNAKARFSSTDTLTDQSLFELSERLRRQISDVFKNPTSNSTGAGISQQNPSAGQ